MVATMPPLLHHIGRSALVAGLLGLCLTVWLAALGGFGVVLYRALFRFDAFHRSNWVEAYRQFMAGATIPFDFVAIGCGLLLAGGIGGILVLVRAPRLLLALRHCRLTAAMIDAAIAGFDRLSPGRWRPAFGPGAAALNSLVTRAAHRRRPATRSVRDGVEQPAPPPPAAAESPEPPSLGPAGEMATQAPAAPDPSPSPSDGDIVSFGRAMALFEVWGEPPPEWMESALREELAGLSATGWGLLAEGGPTAHRLLAVAAARRMLPVDEPARSIVDHLLTGQPVGEEPLPIDADPDTDGGCRSGAPESGRHALPGAPRMTLSAAWLCELLDNYLTLEEGCGGTAADDSGQTDSRCASLFGETAGQLDLAMRSMGEDDWASLDRFPDRARQVRVLTDRLREDFRGRHDGGSASPREPRSRADLLAAAMAGRGFSFSALPPLGGRAVCGDGVYVARRDDWAVVIGLHPLDGRLWTTADGPLGDWRSDDGRSAPSPCAAVWRRVALLRSLGGTPKRVSGLVVVADGRFDDESGLAVAADRERRRIGVGLAWLDRSMRPLPDVGGYLADLAGGAPTG
jgi:hypothetical protein